MRKLTLFLFFISINLILNAESKLINEKIFIEVNNDYSVKVNIEMEFVNMQGFESILAFPENENIQYKNFQAFWNNEKLIIEKESPREGKYYQIENEYYTFLYKFTVKNKSSKKAIHRVSYLYDPFYYSNQKYDEKEGYLIEYILKTGSLWNKKLKKLFIEVKFQKPICPKVQRLEPTYRGKCKNNFVWEFIGGNIDLTQNVKLLVAK